MPRDRTPEAFDYIIAGAGSAGCVLAARLSEDARCRVLLLEAGGSDARAEVQIPAAFIKTFHTELDWNYYTEPQVHLGGRQLFWPRGRVLGGCSSINAMIYIRGHRSDYDGWESLGNPGWGWSAVQPFFLRAEHFVPGPAAQHGSQGPLHVSELRTVNPLSRAFVAAAQQAGLPFAPDFNTGETLGAGFFHVTQRRGQRCSASAAYLDPARGRPNLKVLTGAQVLKISIEGSRATGIQYAHEGAMHEARAGQEVLLCGGAVNSPQLLLLSGVGPADDLRRHGIEVRTNLPGVGGNLQDHPVIGVLFESKRAISLSAAETLLNLLRYKLFKSGPLTSNVAEAGAFVRTRPDLPAPDLQFHFVPALVENHAISRRRPHGFTLAPVLIRPRSRGKVWLRSGDPLAAPAIDPHYLSDPEDARVLADGVRLALEIVAQKAFARYRGEELVPGKSAADAQAIRRFLRDGVETLYHPVGTCKMGRDENAVVDAKLRVHGVGALRVVDASVMPVIPGGNTNTPTVMIAERAAEMIRRGD